MTQQEIEMKRHDILIKIADAMNSGDEKLENQLMKELPIEASTAYAIQQVWGMEVLKDYNIELGKVVYGEDTFK